MQVIDIGADGNSALFSQFFYKPKTGLKKPINLKN